MPRVFVTQKALERAFFMPGRPDRKPINSICPNARYFPDSRPVLAAYFATLKLANRVPRAMNEQDDPETEYALLTEKGRLRHENKFLHERVENLKEFKKKFFEVQRELTVTRDQLLISMEQLNLVRWKDRVQATVEDQDGVVQDEGSNEEIIRFFHKSFLAVSYNDLVDAVFHAVESLNLKLLVQIRHHGKVINFSTDKNYEAAALSLVERYRDEAEIVELDAGLVISHHYFSMAMDGLPTNRDKKYQHLKEYLEIVAAGANTRVDTLAKKLELDELQDNIYKIFRKVNQSFEDIRDNLDNQIIAISEMYLNFEKNVRARMQNMTLTDQERKEIQQMVAEAKSELNLMLTSSLTVDENFMSVMKRLELAYAPRSRHP